MKHLNLSGPWTEENKAELLKLVSKIGFLDSKNQYVKIPLFLGQSTWE